MRDSVITPLWSTTGRRVVLLLTVVVAVGTAAVTEGDLRLAQSAVSVPLPFLGVLLARDLRPRSGTALLTRARRHRLLWSRVAAGTAAALAIAVLTLLACALASGTWSATLAPACFVVQAVALQIGMAFGLVVRPAWVAMLTDATVPVGLWAAAGAVGLRWAQRWLFPYGSVDDLISHRATAVDWVQEGVVVLLWVVVPISLGWRRL